MGTFFSNDFLDELFLTFSPQVAGRAGSPERMGLVAAQLLAPDKPVWGRLSGVKKVGDFLFLRYMFKHKQ